MCVEEREYVWRELFVVGLVKGSWRRRCTTTNNQDKVKEKERENEAGKLYIHKVYTFFLKELLTSVSLFRSFVRSFTVAASLYIGVGLE